VKNIDRVIAVTIDSRSAAPVPAQPVLRSERRFLVIASLDRSAPDRCPLRPFDRLGRFAAIVVCVAALPAPLHPPFDPNFGVPPRSRWSGIGGGRRGLRIILLNAVFPVAVFGVAVLFFESFPFDPDVSRNLCRPAPYCCSAGPDSCVVVVWSASFASTADHRLREYPPRRRRPTRRPATGSQIDLMRTPSRKDRQPKPSDRRLPLDEGMELATVSVRPRGPDQNPAWSQDRSLAITESGRA